MLNLILDIFSICSFFFSLNPIVRFLELKAVTFGMHREKYFLI
jgi:hypothetical protein